MLCTCTECGWKVSDRARFCPNCGQSEPWKWSKEHCEDIISNHLSDDWSDCPYCRRESVGEPISTRVVASEHCGGGPGYVAKRTLRCSKCGREWEVSIFWDPY